MKILLHKILFSACLLFIGYFFKFGDFLSIGLNFVLVADILLIAYCVFSVIRGRVRALEMYFAALLLFLPVAAMYFNIILFDSNIIYLKYIIQLGLIVGFVLFAPRPGAGIMNSAFIIFCLIIIYFVVSSIGTGSHYIAILGEGFRDQYLTLSDLIAMICLTQLALIAEERRFDAAMRNGLAVFGLFGILFFGSRSSMLFYLASISIYIYTVFYKANISRKFGVLLICVLASLAVVIYIVDNKGQFYRLFSIFNYEGSDNYVERDELTGNFINSIYNDLLSIIFGGGVVEDGAYAHNYLSIWQLYGLPFFVIFSLIHMISIAKLLRNSVATYRLFPLFVYLSLSALLTRAVVGVIFPFLFALILFIFFHYPLGAREGK